jgi:hypothetical protein
MREKELFSETLEFIRFILRHRLGMNLVSDDGSGIKMSKSFASFNMTE